MLLRLLISLAFTAFDNVLGYVKHDLGNHFFTNTIRSTSNLPVLLLEMVCTKDSNGLPVLWRRPVTLNSPYKWRDVERMWGNAWNGIAAEEEVRRQKGTQLFSHFSIAPKEKISSPLYYKTGKDEDVQSQRQTNPLLYFGFPSTSLFLGAKGVRKEEEWLTYFVFIPHQINHLCFFVVSWGLVAAIAAVAYAIYIFSWLPNFWEGSPVKLFQSLFGANLSVVWPFFCCLICGPWCGNML